MDKNSEEPERMAQLLEGSGRYKVLRRLIPRQIINPPDGSETRKGLFVDVETTGLDPSSDEVVELAMVPFTFGRDGRIFEVRRPFRQLREPNRPIPPEASAVNGITDQMVAGTTIDIGVVDEMVGQADLIIAHNADFDRRFVERLSRSFEGKPWACSMTQVDWGAEGFEGCKLEYLAMKSGFFYERHKAMHDCFAGIELLATVLPSTGKTAMAQLLQNAFKETTRLSVHNCPFDMNPLLRGRGYRFGRDVEGRAVWQLNVVKANVSQEKEFLAAASGGVLIEECQLTACVRFSDRCPL